MLAGISFVFAVQDLLYDLMHLRTNHNHHLQKVPTHPTYHLKFVPRLGIDWASIFSSKPRTSFARVLS